MFGCYIYLGAALSSSEKSLCLTRMFSTMASINKSVSAIAVLGSVVIVILDMASATNLFAPCKQKSINLFTSSQNGDMQCSSNFYVCG